jgi:hypothetical protein
MPVSHVHSEAAGHTAKQLRTDDPRHCVSITTGGGGTRPAAPCAGHSSIRPWSQAEPMHRGPKGVTR